MLFFGMMLLIRFSYLQHCVCRFREGSMHEICNELSYECMNLCRYQSLNYLRLILLSVDHDILSSIHERTFDEDQGLLDVDHKILLLIYKRVFNDVSAMMHIICTRVKTLLHNLDISCDMCISHMSNIMIDFALHTMLVVDKHQLCSEHDMFYIEGREKKNIKQHIQHTRML